MNTTTQESDIAQLNASSMNNNLSTIGKEFAIRNCIVKLVVSAYNGNKKDNKLTQEAIQEHGVKGKRLSMRKYILTGDELNSVITAVQSTRNHLNSKSLPWENEGERIIPATQVIDLKSEIEERIRDIMTKVDALIIALPDIIERDRMNLKDTFNLADYPTADELRKKFAARIEIRPVAVNFIVEGIEASHQKLIQQDIENQISSTLKDTKVYQLKELSHSISHLAGKLADKDKAFKGSSIENILDSAANIKNLILDHDPKMIEIADTINKDFNSLNPDTLRENLTVRKETCDLAQKRIKEIESAMAMFM